MGINPLIDLFKTQILRFAAYLILALWPLFPGFSPFIKDEADLQKMVAVHFNSGTFPTIGIIGSAGIKYGPTAQWFYSFTYFLSHDVKVAVFFHCLLFVGSGLLLYRTLKKTFDEESATLSLLLFSTAPFMLFYARDPWDNTFLVPISAGIVYMVQKLNEFSRASLSFGKTVRYWMGLGVLVGLAINAHLMVLPVLGALGIVTLIYLINNPKDRLNSLIGLGLGILSLALIVLPYFLELRPTLKEGIPTPLKAEMTFLGHLWEFAIGSIQQASFQGSYYFFEGSDLKAYIGDTHPIIGRAARFIISRDYLSWFVKLFAALGLTLPFWGRRAFKNYRPSYIEWFACLSFILAVTYYQITFVPAAAQYFQSIWWLVFFGNAAWFFNLPKSRIKAVVRAIVIGVFLINGFFILCAGHFIKKFEGTRGQFFGTVLSSQISTAHKLCESLNSTSLNAAVVDIQGLSLDPGSLEYLVSNDSLCDGRQIDFVRGDTPESLRGRVVTHSFSYSDFGGYSAALEIKKL